MTKILKNIFKTVTAIYLTIFLMVIGFVFMINGIIWTFTH